MNELIEPLAIEFLTNRLGHRFLPLTDVFQLVRDFLLIDSRFKAPCDPSGIEWISPQERERRAARAAPGFYTRYPSLGHIRRYEWIPSIQYSISRGFRRHLDKLTHRIHKTHRLLIPPTSSEFLLASLKTEYYLFLRALRVKIATIILNQDIEEVN